MRPAGRSDAARRRLRSALRRQVTGGPVYASLAAFLVAWVVLVVPLGALAFGVPVRLLLVGGVVVYALSITALDLVFEGLCAALFVTAAFNARAFFDTSGALGVGIRLVDLLTLACLGWLLLDRGFDRTWVRGTGRQVVVGCFSVFVLWTFLTAVVGNGPSSSTALEYGQRQLRYLLLLVTATVLVTETDPRSVLSPLALGTAGALAFAADEVFAGRAGYLVDFGFLGPVIERAWPSPSLTSFRTASTVLYEGGPIGHSRTMVGMAVVFVPLALAVATRSRRDVVLAGAGLLGLVTVVASSSHAGVVGLYGAVACVSVYWLSLALRDVGANRAAKLVGPVAVAAGSLALVWVAVAVAGGAERVLFVSTDNLDVRLAQYSRAVDLAARYPLFGVGGGRNVHALTGSVIHSLFFQQLAATGVTGFLAYVASQATATWLALQRLRRSLAEDGWLWAGVLGGMIGFYSYSFWVVAYWWDPINAVYWILVGVVVGTDPPTDQWGDLRERVRDALPVGTGVDDGGS